jgi:uncharacterized membrane protein (UPF0127 family)
MRPHFLRPLLEPAPHLFVLRNDRTGEAVATRLETAFESAERRRGLLGRTALDADSALIIAPCNAIHTFFMKFNIDVAFVDRGGTILRASRQLRPWRIALAWGALAAIELQAGTLERTQTRAGDRLVLNPTLVSR